VQDRGARVGAQHPCGEQRRGGAATEAAAGFVDHEHTVGVTVEGEADVEAAGHDTGLQIALVGRLDRIGRVIREVPSSSPYITSRVICGRRSNTAGTTRPPMPLAVSATTFSGRSAVGSMNDTTWSAKADSRFLLLAEPARAAWAGPRPESTSAAIALTSSSPLSTPTGRAPLRQNFTPLYWAGLCDAVNIAEAHRACRRRSIRSVLQAGSTTSTPCSMTRLNASTSSVPEETYVSHEDAARRRSGRNRRRGRGRHRC
jgi:hypothetical protein